MCVYIYIIIYIICPPPKYRKDRPEITEGTDSLQGVGMREGVGME